MLENITVDGTPVVGVYDKSKMTRKESFNQEVLSIIKDTSTMSTEQRVNLLYDKGYRKINSSDIKLIATVMRDIWMKKEMPQEILDIYNIDPNRSMEEACEIWITEVLTNE